MVEDHDNLWAATNVRQLEAFQAVMQAGGVTRAGEVLHVSQPAVSQLIAQLERACGFRLFERRGSKLSPTREGEAFFTEVQRVFVGVGKVARVAEALRERSWGSLRLAAFPALTRRILPAIVSRFCEVRPDVRFELESMRSRSLIDAVAAQQVDIGLSFLPPDRPEVEGRQIARLRGVCILPRSHRLVSEAVIHARDLEGEAFISLGNQDQSRTAIDRVFDALGVTWRIQIATGQSETTHSFVAERAGVAIVDPISVFNHDRDDVVTRRFEPEVAFGVWLITPRSARTSLLLTSFLDHAEPALQEAFEGFEASSVAPQAPRRGRRARPTRAVRRAAPRSGCEPASDRGGADD